MSSIWYRVRLLGHVICELEIESDADTLEVIPYTGQTGGEHLVWCGDDEPQMLDAAAADDHAGEQR